MKTQEITDSLTNGAITYIDKEEAAGDIPWSRHPKFKGVYLKHLVKGADTQGRLSCHIVKLDPRAVLEEHVHEDQWELHEVIEGEGAFFLQNKETPYHPGHLGVIPEGVEHKVAAGKSGLVLLAKFFPALV